MTMTMLSMIRCEASMTSWVRVAGGRQAIRVRVDDAARAEPLLRGLPFVTDVVRHENRLELAVRQFDDDAAIAVTRALVQGGVGVAEVVRQSESLEARFLEVTAGTRTGEMGEVTA